MQGVITRARLNCAPLSVVSFGVNYLKAVNEREGHDRGDLLLAAAGRALHLSLRRDDVIVRHSGDEFVCALPAIDDVQTMAAIGRVGRTMRGLIAGGMVSAGYAQLIAGDTLDDLIDRADADRQGRRRRRRVPGTPSSTYAASIGCAACGDRISLREFVVDASSRPTRTADCPGCGEVTLITLA
ncbi:MAG: diguanylate cyclase [Frankiaceae bacterium]|jgi:diguanylate cyclase (GGDEF)-like protein|nr:diguanylate cyclase [Frankiaceae bacterium]MDQ1698248.1 diguanylate cyclase [Frankiaceae bacterium]